MFGFFKNKKSSEEKTIPASNQPAPLIEGQDFYIENGFYVFTEHYHKNRGYCCDSGCRHCPYKDKESL